MPTRRTRSADPPQDRQQEEVPALREEVGDEEKEEVFEERELSSFEDVIESEAEQEQLEFVTDQNPTEPVTETINMADPFDYLSNHLDGEAPPATILSVAEQLEGNIPFPKKDRKDLSCGLGGDIVKWYRVDLRIGTLREKMRMYDMLDVFDIPTSFVHHPGYGIEVPAPDAKISSLLLRYSEVSMENIKKHSVFLASVSRQKYKRENLAWSGELILNSCSEELRTRIKTQAQGLPEIHRTGPVYFKMMMEFVVVRDSTTLRGLIDQFESLSVTDFPGENVRSYCTVAHGVFNMLSNVDTFTGNATVPDFVIIIERSLVKSSTEEFNRKLTTFRAVAGDRCTVEDITAKANNLYSGLIGASLWAAGDGEDETGFFAGNCYNCGKEGHMAKDCKAPKKENNNERGGHREGRGGRGRGRGGKGGRGGRGGQGQGSGKQNDKSSNKGDKDLYRTPPKKGEPHKKVNDGKMVYWCGRCNRWNDHDTDTHRAMVANFVSDDSTKSEGKKNSDSDAKDKDKEGGQGNYVGKLTPRF
ncbi:hypothetical protein FisN_12Lu132 [Fistulifera solaris]|uniref:CCHC-type domain-containing protein n=1 Tax=Fistulifera solaris TaxID=1519565 RepID=A0A1Z5K549_FISSO|nr:hypothetical protein FisN_12Lu132 [Fistulifera solaris]|eukprot:GAX21370.1 hypothetical protein FisN_12Lu132 [Fistulifera solaris]